MSTNKNIKPNSGLRRWLANVSHPSHTKRHFAMASFCANWWIVWHRESYPESIHPAVTTKWWTTSISKYKEENPNVEQHNSTLRRTLHSTPLRHVDSCCYWYVRVTCVRLHGLHKVHNAIGTERVRDVWTFFVKCHVIRLCVSFRLDACSPKIAMQRIKSKETIRGKSSKIPK